MKSIKLMNQMKRTTIWFVAMLMGLIFTSCDLRDRTERNLSSEDIEYVEGLIPLETDEKIEMFETNGGLKGIKTSGNFITNKRLASYWIDGKNDEIHSINYTEIDSLILVDKIGSVSDASYVKVYSASQENFNVYVDADSVRTWSFYNKALQNWIAKK